MKRFVRHIDRIEGTDSTVRIFVRYIEGRCWGALRVIVVIVRTRGRGIGLGHLVGGWHRYGQQELHK